MIVFIENKIDVGVNSIICVSYKDSDRCEMLEVISCVDFWCKEV